MRWIFVTLVVVNLLLLGFFINTQEKEVAPTVVEQPTKGKAVVLLSELDHPLESTERPAPKVKRTNTCFAVGPFSERLDGRHLLARAEALGFKGKLKEIKVESNKPAEYWVYVPPRPSREQALSVLRELQKRKFDSFIVAQGEMSNGVSLGLFRNKSSAYSIQEQVQKLGIEVDVKVINESVSEYWVEIDENPQLNSAIRERIQANDAELRWEMTECY